MSHLGLCHQMYWSVARVCSQGGRKGHCLKGISVTILTGSIWTDTCVRAKVAGIGEFQTDFVLFPYVQEVLWKTTDIDALQIWIEIASHEKTDGCDGFKHRQESLLSVLKPITPVRFSIHRVWAQHHLLWRVPRHWDEICRTRVGMHSLRFGP